MRKYSTNLSFHFLFFQNQRNTIFENGNVSLSFIIYYVFISSVKSEWIIGININSLTHATTQIDQITAKLFLSYKSMI